MDYNFKCSICNWRSYVDPILTLMKKLQYQCTKCSSVYYVARDDLGIKE